MAHTWKALSMRAQAPRCMNQARGALRVATGKRRASNRIHGVASAHGSQEKKSVKKSVVQARCMPSAFMLKTVCAASKRAKPAQSEAIHFRLVVDVRALGVAIG